MYKNIFKFNYVTYVLLGISAICLVFLSYLIKDISILLTWFLGGCVVFLLRQNLKKELFCVSFAINTIIAIVFCIENYYTTGYLHTLFLDDKDFYKITINLLDDDIETYFGLSRLSVFFIITTKVYQVLELIGIQSKSYFHFLIYNIVLGSLIPVVIYYLSNNLFKNRNIAIKSACLVAVFPSVVYFNSIGLRDVWVTFFFTLFVAIYTVYKGSFYLKWFYLIIIFISIFLVRHQNVLYPILFIITYHFFNSDDKRVKRNILVFSSLSFSVFFIYYFNIIEEYYFWYKDFNYQVNGPDSLGLKLKHESGIFGKVAYFVYFIFGPFPLLTFTKITVARVFLDIGTILWYLVVPFYIYLSIKKFKKPFTSTFFLVFLMSCVILSVITGHLRHKVVFFPIILMLFYGFIVEVKPAIISNILKKSILIYMLLGAVYVVVKYIWI